MIVIKQSFIPDIFTDGIGYCDQGFLIVTTTFQDYQIQYNLDSTCPDSMFYQLVRHFLQEHITYFVTKNQSLST